MRKDHTALTTRGQQPKLPPPRLAPRLFAQAAATDVEGGFPSQELRLAARGRPAHRFRYPAALGGAGLGSIHQPQHAVAAAGAVAAHRAGQSGGGACVWEGHVNALLLIQQLRLAPAQVARYRGRRPRRPLISESGIRRTRPNGVHLEAAAECARPLPAARGQDVCLRCGPHHAAFADGRPHCAPYPPRAPRPGARTGRRGLRRPAAGSSYCCAPMPSRRRWTAAFWQPLGMRATASFRADLTGPGNRARLTSLAAPDAYYRAAVHSAAAAHRALRPCNWAGPRQCLKKRGNFLRGLGRTDDPYQRQRLGEMLAILLESGRQWVRGAAEHAARPPMPPRRAAAARPPGRAGRLRQHDFRTAIETICLDMLRLAERCVGARGLLQPPALRAPAPRPYALPAPARARCRALADVGRFALSSDRQGYQLVPLERQ